MTSSASTGGYETLVCTSSHLVCAKWDELCPESHAQALEILTVLLGGLPLSVKFTDTIPPIDPDPRKVYAYRAKDLFSNFSLKFMYQKGNDWVFVSRKLQDTLSAIFAVVAHSLNVIGDNFSGASVHVSGLIEEIVWNDIISIPDRDVLTASDRGVEFPANEILDDHISNSNFYMLVGCFNTRDELKEFANCFLKMKEKYNA